MDGNLVSYVQYVMDLQMLVQMLGARLLGGKEEETRFTQLLALHNMLVHFGITTGLLAACTLQF